MEQGRWSKAWTVYTLSTLSTGHSKGQKMLHRGAGARDLAVLRPPVTQQSSQPGRIPSTGLVTASSQGPACLGW